jgi:kynurenine formamidase
MTDQRDGADGPGGRQMTETDFRALLDRLRAQASWGSADTRGSLNNITPDRVMAALGEVKLGRSVSLASPVEHEPAADNPHPSRHTMTQDASDAPDQGLSFALDQISMNIHGNADTHIDALCHVIYDGELYNNRPAATVTEQGAGELTISVAANGIAGRGVLLDIPRARGVAWLEPGEHVTADDITAAEKDQQVQLGQGDLALVRVGHTLRRAQQGPWDVASARAGLHPAALEYLADRKIGLLGSDGNNDTAPSMVQGVDYPVHVLAIVGLGLHLIDYLDLSDVAPICAEMKKWSFLCMIAPLRLQSATGSPVNPIALV